jgi:hypothetical protein
MFHTKECTIYITYICTYMHKAIYISSIAMKVQTSFFFYIYIHVSYKRMHNVYYIYAQSHIYFIHCNENPDIVFLLFLYRFFIHKNVHCILHIYVLLCTKPYIQSIHCNESPNIVFLLFLYRIFIHFINFNSHLNDILKNSCFNRSFCLHKNRQFLGY